MGGRGGSTAVNFSISNRRVQSTDVPVLAAYLPPTIYTSRLTRSLFFPSRDRSDPDHLFVSEKKEKRTQPFTLYHHHRHHDDGSVPFVLESFWLFAVWFSMLRMSYGFRSVCAGILSFTALRRRKKCFGPVFLFPKYPPDV
ncbi:hypothetical protein BDD12DRAFT_829554, partial [Trichophaea hybrida]